MLVHVCCKVQEVVLRAHLVALLDERLIHPPDHVGWALLFGSSLGEGDLPCGLQVFRKDVAKNASWRNLLSF